MTKISQPYTNKQSKLYDTCKFQITLENSFLYTTSDIISTQHLLIGAFNLLKPQTMTEQIGLGSDPGTICLQSESEESTCKLLSTRMFLTDQIQTQCSPSGSVHA